METKKIRKFLAKWNEFIALPLAVIILVFSPMALRLIDTEAGVLDMGVLQLLLFGLVKFLFASGFAWLLLKWSKPELYKTLDEGYIELLSKEQVADPEKYQYNQNLKTCLKHSLLFYLVLLGGLLYAMTGIA